MMEPKPRCLGGRPAMTEFSLYDVSVAQEFGEHGRYAGHETTLVGGLSNLTRGPATS
jgi:hypothetical protein